MKGATIFPLEMDLSRDAFAYKSEIINTGESDDDDIDAIATDNNGSSDIPPLADLTSSDSANVIDTGLSSNVESLLDLGDDTTQKKNSVQHEQPQKDAFDWLN